MVRFLKWLVENVPSSVISTFWYERETKTLFIRFVSGLIYRYLEVPEKVFDSLKQSRSKGIYFNNEIKGVYEFEKVEDWK